MSIFDEQPQNPDYLVGMRGNDYVKAPLAAGFWNICLKVIRPDEKDSGWDRLLLTADRPVNTTKVFPVFLRYKARGRNGKHSANRQRKSKWYAYRYTARAETFYDAQSMLRMELRQGFARTNTYEIKGWHPTLGNFTESVPQTVIRNFLYNDRYGTPRLHLGKRGSEVGGNNYIGINNCGVALADKYGQLVSNVVRVKFLVVNYGTYTQNWLRMLPMRDK